MALRPFAFGVRLRDKQRTVRVIQEGRNPGRFRVEDRRRGEPNRRREHDSLAGALRDAASTWRGRLH